MRSRSILGVLASFAFVLACDKQSDTIPVTGITLEPTSVELVDGESVTITAIISPGDASNKQVNWTSSNPSIRVSNGKITSSFRQGAPTTLINGKPALGQGTITATTEDGGKTAKCQVTVYAKVIAVTGIRLTESSLHLTRGESHTLTATVDPNNATDKAVRWTSSDDSVASVDQKGTITAVSVGEATITASAGGLSASCSVNVIIPVTSISLDNNLLLLTKGSVAVLTAIVSPDDATDKTVKWSSNNPSVASVDQNGRVTAVDAGDAVITASAGGFSATCSVYCLNIPVSAVVLNKTSLSLARGASETLKATVSPSDASDKTVKWSSDNPSVATVDQNGQVTAVNSGTATITASAGKVSATCAVSVFVPVTLVSLNSEKLTLSVGETALLEATVLPEDATDKNVTWYSSNPDVAAVDGGRITALDFGQAVITAQVGNLSASCMVTVLVSSPSGVVAGYWGGDVSSSGTLIEPGSRLVFGVSNMSTETITVKSVQLLDGESGEWANIVLLGTDLGAGLTQQWTVDVPGSGIHSPTAVFTFIFRGEEYTCSASYHSVEVRVAGRP
ncbi:MAG: Ig domain-containing protein [Bacteroidales bacterium]|nr:Ig domain-containing protein [Bacteroidales bacterium]